MNIEKTFQGTITTTATNFKLPYTAKTVIISNEGTDSMIFSCNGIINIVPAGEIVSFANNNLKNFSLTASTSSTTAEIKVEYPESLNNFEEFLPDSFIKKARTKFEIFDDFLYQTITEADTPFIFNKGTDAQATDPAIPSTKGQGGTIDLVTGNNSGTLSDDGSQLVVAIPVQADSGALTMEARLKINSAITGVSVNVGFTDSSSLEEPFTIATAAITSNATDGACFVYDDGATSKTWFACAVDSDVDDTGNGTTSIAPVADTYQTLRIEVSEDGNEVQFYINGLLVKTLNNAGLTPSVDLYATIIANATTTASKTVTVDYIYVSHNR